MTGPRKRKVYIGATIFIVLLFIIGLIGGWLATIGMDSGRLPAGKKILQIMAAAQKKAVTEKNYHIEEGLAQGGETSHQRGEANPDPNDELSDPEKVSTHALAEGVAEGEYFGEITAIDEAKLSFKDWATGAEHTYKLAGNTYFTYNGRETNTKVLKTLLLEALPAGLEIGDNGQVEAVHVIFHIIEGEVTAVDAKNRTIEIRALGGEVDPGSYRADVGNTVLGVGKFRVQPYTRLQRNFTEIGLNAVKPGDHVLALTDMQDGLIKLTISGYNVFGYLVQIKPKVLAGRLAILVNTGTLDMPRVQTFYLEPNCKIYNTHGDSLSLGELEQLFKINDRVWIAMETYNRLVSGQMWQHVKNLKVRAL